MNTAERQIEMAYKHGLDAKIFHGVVFVDW